jgi:hypothetical protein
MSDIMSMDLIVIVALLVVLITIVGYAVTSKSDTIDQKLVMSKLEALDQKLDSQGREFGQKLDSQGQKLDSQQHALDAIQGKLPVFVQISCDECCVSHFSCSFFSLHSNLIPLLFSFSQLQAAPFSPTQLEICCRTACSLSV